MDVNPSTDPSVIFASDSTCILGPDTTEGPYCTSYVSAIAISDILTSADVTGELIRSDITEDQQGVPLYLDMQMINPRTCEPVPDIYLDFWQCNSTVCAYCSLVGRREMLTNQGVYSGVVAFGNGNPADQSNMDNTFLRGLQKTDEIGVAQIKTLFPGHYHGRATHIHGMRHASGERYELTALQCSPT